MKGRYVAICLHIHSLPFLTCVLQSYFLCIYQTHVSPKGLGLASENRQQDMGPGKEKRWVIPCPISHHAPVMCACSPWTELALVCLWQHICPSWAREGSSFLPRLVPWFFSTPCNSLSPAHTSQIVPFLKFLPLSPQIVPSVSCYDLQVQMWLPNPGTKAAGTEKKKKKR